jgi:hypothetical protein
MGAPKSGTTGLNSGDDFIHVITNDTKAYALGILFDYCD